MKFAFITPRYGADISAGAEHACRLLAEQVSERHDVDVLTTCARDHATWKNEYRRDRTASAACWSAASPSARCPTTSRSRPSSQRLQTSPRSRAEELEWVRLHGPWSPA